MSAGKGSEIPSVHATVPGFGDRPAIAVLPFSVRGDGEDRQYLGDGLAEDLICRLGCLGQHPVIGRSSSFRYRGRANPRDIGRELGVACIIEGVATIASDTLTLKLRAIETQTGKTQLERSLRTTLGELPAAQSEIAHQIIAAVHPDGPVSPAGGRVGGTKSREAWDLSLRGAWHLNQVRKTACKQARVFLNEAVQIDPELSYAYWALLMTHYYDIQYEWSDSIERTVSEVIRVGESAFERSPQDPHAHFGHAIFNSLSGQLDAAIASIELALQLNPSCPSSCYFLGILLAISDRNDESLAYLQRAIDLSPLDSEIGLFFSAVALAHFGAGRYEDAREWATRSIRRRSDWPRAYRVLAGACGQLGLLEEGRAAARAGRRRQPRFSEGTVRMLMHEISPDFTQRFFEGLHRVGWND